jgi:hypothetical protein
VRSCRRHQRGDLRAVHALARKYAEVARRVHPLVRGANFLPHEIRELHKQDLFGFDFVERIEWRLFAAIM